MSTTQDKPKAKRAGSKSAQIVSLIATGLFCLAATLRAQDYQIRSDYMGGYNVYGPGYRLQQQIQPDHMGGYNVYGPGYRLQQRIQPDYMGGYNVHTMPRSYGYGYGY